MKNSIRYQELCQEGAPFYLEPLSDKGRSGREKPWRDYKLQNEKLAAVYGIVDPAKELRLLDCCKELVFLVDPKTEKKRLKRAYSCRVRLCPLCSWRRSLKNFHNTMKCVRYIQASEEKLGKIEYIFVTLTVRNCKGDSLSKALDDLFAAVKRLYQREEVKRAWLGAVRNLEVTHNINPNSDSFDTFHPHFHMIVAVRPSYFTSRDYISHDRLVALWRDCLRADYDPQVDIRRVKPRKQAEQASTLHDWAAKSGLYDAGVAPDPVADMASAVAECSKYAAKASDYLISDNWELTVDTVRVLDRALTKRRLVNYGGIFRDVKQLLELDDCEDGDLVHVGDEEDTLEDAQEVTYFWYSGYRQYYKL